MAFNKGTGSPFFKDDDGYGAQDQGRELDTALIINPFDVDQIVDALDRALGMPIEERRARYEAMMSWLQEHDVHSWRESFLKALQEPQSLLPGQPTIRARRTRRAELSNV